MNLAIAPTPLAISGKHSSAPIVVVKGDIEACKQFASDYADNSDKPRHEALACVWLRFIGWSFPEKEIKWWQS